MGKTFDKWMGRQMNDCSLDLTMRI